MKPSVRRRLLSAAGILAVAAAAAGCTAPVPADPTGGLAVVVGGRANMPPAAVSGVAGQEVTNAVITRAEVSVVVADGAPFVVADERLSGLSRDDSGSTERREVLESAISTATAATAETDLLTALELAAREVQDAPGRQTVLVVDSGLSTAGALDFRHKGMLDVAPADLVASLAAKGALPDLSGVHVIFQGLGDTAAPQPVLGAVVREHVIALWTAIALGAGALDVNVERAPLTGEPPTARPPVGVVGSGSGMSCAQNTVVLTGGDVAFEADRAVFQDDVAASETLRPIAESLKAAGVTATLTGTTARVGDADGQRRLSQQRAQAVADLLSGLGVPAQRLTVVGVGSEFPGYVRDHDGRGNLLPREAAMNRKVVISLSGTGSTTLCR